MSNRVILKNCLFISKNQNKQYCELIYLLGIALVQLSTKELETLSLPQELEDYIKFNRNIGKIRNKKRQQQLIAKTIRDYNWSYEHFVLIIGAMKEKSQKILLLAQVWFSKLINQEITAEEFITMYNVKDRLNFSLLLSLSIKDIKGSREFLLLINTILSRYVF